MKVASEHAEREGAGAGVGVEEGLLLDGVELEGGHVARGDQESAVLVPADLADPLLPGEDQAAVAARVAAEAPLGEPLVELALAGQPGKGLLQGNRCCHDPP